MLNHDERTQALAEHFKEFIGNRVFILVPQFPFMYIGIILDVIEDQILLDVERTHIEQLENRIWEVHIDTIHTFFIERDGGPTIPVF
ncbi:hypothetical protein N0O92_12515 [Alkalihalobacillus sp. MEB130]|uniref:hypothetical protein n=1 Tax=Alkalihalobacillus sp. MEB130 TaxID=2976704 RepID=UPI0028DD6DBD|nr:hypothetical protein [Alkalihalobacillus sp. MEB130]MDT8861058.1 hypothetical protein [Alkalihalobacillus sp. MEB130]